MGSGVDALCALVTYGGQVKAPRLVLASAALLLLPLLATGTNAMAAGVPEARAAVNVDDVPPALLPYYTQALVWSPCEGGLECTWLTVPLDYANPTAAQITIRVNRQKAKGPADQRQGSLVLNPGGPGGTGLDFTSYVATQIAPKVNVAFDIVGFDPRGVGQSAPVTCLTGRQTTVFLESNSTPDTPAEIAETMSLGRGMANGCLKFSPNLARHVGTENTVRDMDVLRAALGDANLNWLGFSYGTYLGALYTQAFPTHVGRFVLDGAMNPANNLMQMDRGQSRGFQVALSRWAADCSTLTSCPYKGPAKSVLAGINALLDKLETTTMPAGGKRRLNQSSALTGIVYSMYSKQLWPWLRTALRRANANDGSGLLILADMANDRTGPNTYATNMTSAFYAIGCWDEPATPGAAGLAAAARLWSRHAPVPKVAQAVVWSSAPCSVWFGHTTRIPAPVNSTTTAPILIVGNIYDPATPYPWAVALNQQLKTSTLLTFNGDGHTAYGSVGSTCIDTAVDAYLLTGTPPPPGVVCN